jgi:hypothetical protein
MEKSCVAGSIPRATACTLPELGETTSKAPSGTAIPPNTVPPNSAETVISCQVLGFSITAPGAEAKSRLKVLNKSNIPWCLLVKQHPEAATISNGGYFDDGPRLQKRRCYGATLCSCCNLFWANWIRQAYVSLCCRVAFRYRSSSLA